jgi:hypothetical protein
MKPLIVFLFCIAATPAFAGLGLHVRSVDSTNLAGATVYTLTEKGDTVYGKLDTFYLYWVFDLSPGLYTMTVSHPLYETQTKHVEIDSYGTIENVYLAPRGSKYIHLHGKRPYRSSPNYLAAMALHSGAEQSIMDTARKYGLTYVGMCGESIDLAGHSSVGRVLIFQSKDSIESFGSTLLCTLRKHIQDIGPVFFWDSPLELCVTPTNSVTVKFDGRQRFYEDLAEIQRSPFVTRVVPPSFGQVYRVYLDDSVGYGIADLVEQWSKLPKVVSVSIETVAPIHQD